MSESKQNSPESFETPIPNSGKVSEETSPSVKSHKFLIVGLVLLLLLTAGAAAYVFAQNQSLKSQLGLPGFKLGSAKTCDYNGQTYQIGEEVPSIDGCNNCNCDTDGQVACTDMACINEEAEVDPFADWVTYTNGIFQIKYPSNFEAEEEYGGYLKLMQLAPDHKTGTELYDGIMLSFETREIANIEPIAFAQNKINESNENGLGGVISSAKQTLFNGYDAAEYSYGGLGETRYLIVQANDNVMFVVIGDASVDPNNLGYEYTVDQILSTFKFTDAEAMSTNKALPTKKPTVPPSTTYTDQEFGYQVSYNPETWMFRHTYGRGGISNSDTSGNPRVNSGFDLHRPSNINPNAVIILNVFEAYGETDIDSWIEQYELNIPSGATSQYIQSDSMKAKEYTFKYDQQDGFDRRLRFFIYEGNVYKMWYSELGQINAEVQNIVETFTP